MYQIAEAIEQQYSREQAVVFPEESGIDLDRIPAPPDFQPQGVADVLIALERLAGSDGRRVLRGFLGRWLSNQLRTRPRRRAAPLPAREARPRGLART